MPRASSPARRRSGAATPPPATGTLPCLVYVVLYHALGAGSLAYYHFERHSVVSPVQFALATFCVLNAWICVCELALMIHCAGIRKRYDANTKALGAGRLPPVFLFAPVTLRQLVSLEYWGVEMWGTYAALDPAYAETASFGFCVDVGNGVTTLLPSILFAAGMTWDVLSARWLGMLGLVSFYQELYGTVVYFFQFFFNRKDKRIARAHVLGVVLPANGIWIALPALGMWASARMILDGSLAVVR